MPNATRKPRAKAKAKPRPKRPAQSDTTPAAERPPRGLNADWLGVWRHALKTLKDQDTWAWELKPLLDEYVFALMEAERARIGFGWLDALERYADDADDLPDIAWTTLGKISGSLPTAWDRHTKRAAGLADQLALTPRGRKAIGLVDDEDQDEPEGFDALDGNVTPITSARSRSA